MTYKKRVVAALLTVLLGLQLCGFAWWNSATVAIDTEQNKLYRYITADSIDKYDEGYYLISGRVASVKSKGESITLESADGGRLICQCDKTISDTVLRYAAGDEAAVYGRLYVDPFYDEKRVKVDKIINPPTAVKSAEYYYTLDGKNFDHSSAIVRSLAGGRVEYRVPVGWKEVELSVKDNGLGTMEGYQYVLNKLPGDKSGEMESMFVCYFDKKLLKDAADMKKPESVEKVIIENIDGKVDKFPAKRVDTYYGQKYKYYLGKYTDAFETGTGYRTEYVFIEDGENGIVVLLYVYREARHVDDAIFTARFLRLKNV